MKTTKEFSRSNPTTTAVHGISCCASTMFLQGHSYRRFSAEDPKRSVGYNKPPGPTMAPSRRPSRAATPLERAPPTASASLPCRPWLPGRGHRPPGGSQPSRPLSRRGEPPPWTGEARKPATATATMATALGRRQARRPAGGRRGGRQPRRFRRART